MACCGARRPVAADRQASAGPLVFELEVAGPLTIYGRATGARYHFPGPSARLKVDPRDAPFVAVTRGLRAVTE